MPGRRFKERRRHWQHQRAMNVSTRIFCLVSFCWLWLPSTAEAHRGSGRLLNGTVLAVDATTRKVVFSQDGGIVRYFVWSKSAKFWRDSKGVSPRELSPGMRVRVNLINPIFGPDYVRRIVLLETTSTATRESRPRSK